MSDVTRSAAGEPFDLAILQADELLLDAVGRGERANAASAGVRPPTTRSARCWLHGVWIWRPKFRRRRWLWWEASQLCNAGGFGRQPRSLALRP